MIDQDTQTLLERSLRGELSPSESEELQAKLANDENCRRYLEEATAAMDLFQEIEQDGLQQIDWERLKQGTWRFGLRRTLGVIFNALLGVWAAYAAMNQAEGISSTLAISIASLVFLSRAYSEYIEQHSFARRIQHASESRDFMDRYAAILRREWKRWRSESGGEFIAALFLIFLGMTGNYPKICILMAAGFLLSSFVHHYFLARPLRREMEELGL